MTKLQAIRDFTSYVLSSPVVIARDKFEDNNFAMDIANSVPRIKLPKDLNMKPDAIDKAFRKNFIEQYPSAQGFSNITITLLHECGHWATRSVMDIVEYDKMKNKAYTQRMYMDIPWEQLATMWAICWLASPVNRKIAKEFEHKYFGR